MTTAERNGVLIALHGHGDDAASAQLWANRLIGHVGAEGHWQVLTPEAPEDLPGVRSWFRSGPRGADPAALADHIESLRSLIAENAGTPTVLAGFSQGAAVVLEAVMRGVEVDLAVVVAGFVPEYDNAEAFRSPPATGHVLLVGATDDDVVPWFMSEDAVPLLVGVPDVRAVEVPGGHTVSDDALSVAAGAVDELIAGREEARS